MAVAVPTRIFVGITVFGLVCSVLTLAAFVLLFTCNAPPPQSVVDLQQRACQTFTGGQKVFLGLAAAFSIAFTVLAWRSLLAGARNDRARRQARAARPASGEAPPPSAPAAKHEEQPPGYQ